MEVIFLLSKVGNTSLIDSKFLTSKIDDMDYRKIIADSWAYTQENKPMIIWLGFVPAIFTSTVSFFYLMYQFFAFRQSYLFNDVDEPFAEDVALYAWGFFQNHFSWTIPIIVFVGVFLLIYLLFPTLTKAAAIQKIARNKSGKMASVGTGFRHGIMSFLPLFEYHLLIKTFSFFSILVEVSFVVRNLGLVLFKIFLPLFVVIIFVSLLLTLLFTYTDFYIVLDDDGVFNSMKRSARLVVINWKHTFLITLLMMIIGIRIIIQALLVFLLPLLVVIFTGYLATVVMPTTSLIIGGIIGIVVFIISAYLNGIVDIFVYTVWTSTFMHMVAEDEEDKKSAVKLTDDIDDENRTLEVHHKNL